MTESKITRHDYEAIQSVVDGVDETARQQEAKWGVGRLELVVPDELREKFRKQLHRFNEAVAAHDVERVRRSGASMRRAWEALARAAEQSGAEVLDPEYWEMALSDGRIIALCRTKHDAYERHRQDRYVEVWTTQEITRLIESFPEIALAKSTFPGAVVESARSKRVSEPLEEDVFVNLPEAAE